MGYIEDIRKKIGTMALVVVGASVLVVDAQGQLLLQLRADDGTWDYAGGSVELDERVEDAARRELFEETGLVANELELLDVFSGPDKAHVYPDGALAHFVDFVYICKDYSGSLVPDPSEVQALQYFPPDALPENIALNALPALHAYRHHVSGAPLQRAYTCAPPLAGESGTPAFVRAIREKVGNDTLLLCGGSVLVQNARGELLLTRRKDNDLWSRPGGIVEPNERVEETAARELFEETGLVAKRLVWLTALSGEGMRHTYPHGDSVCFVDCVFLCTDYTGTPEACPDEVAAMQFFPLDALPEKLSSHMRLLIQQHLMIE